MLCYNNLVFNPNSGKASELLGKGMMARGRKAIQNMVDNIHQT